MSTSPAAPKLPPRHHLELWYRFLKLVPATDWGRRDDQGMRVRPRESFAAWLARLEDDLVLYPTYPLVEHGSVGDFKSHFIEGFHELHVSINLFAPRALIRREVDALVLDRQRSNLGAGISHSAARQLNGPVYVKRLEKVLAVLEFDRGRSYQNANGRGSRRRVSSIEIAEKLLGRNYTREGVAAATISRYRKQGEEILRGVRHGRFPNPLKAADDWSRDHGKPKQTIVRHRIV